MGRTLRVRVPATTANLGSGFDCVGLAFDWYDELTLELLDEPGLEVVVAGAGEGEVPPGTVQVEAVVRDETVAAERWSR